MNWCWIGDDISGGYLAALKTKGFNIYETHWKLSTWRIWIGQYIVKLTTFPFFLFSFLWTTPFAFQSFVMIIYSWKSATYFNKLLKTLWIIKLYWQCPKKFNIQSTNCHFTPRLLLEARSQCGLANPKTTLCNGWLLSPK